MMSESVDLKSVKIKIHRTILEDGLLDIMLGIYLVLSGIYLFNKSLILNFIWFPIALVLIEVIRRRYVFPRSGYVKLSISSTEVIGIFAVIIAGIALLTALTALIAIGIGQPIRGNWRDIITWPLTIFTVIFFCFIAYRFRVPRWYFHGILIGVVILLSKAFDVHGLVIAAGVIITAIGLNTFVRFLQKHPLEQKEIVENNHAS